MKCRFAKQRRDKVIEKEHHTYPKASPAARRIKRDDRFRGDKLSLRDDSLAQIRTDLAVAQSALAARDKTAAELAAALSSERAKSDQLELILGAVSKHTEALRLLESAIHHQAPT